MEQLATIRCYNDLVLAFRARKEALGLSDAALDARANLPSGGSNKYLGPARERGIGAATLETLLMALAVDLIMVPNPEKLARGGEIERRQESHARANHPRISKEAAIKIAWSTVLSKAGRKAAKARWKNSTPEERAAVVAALNIARAARRARTRKAA
jgi:hypothetical protein